MTSTFPLDVAVVAADEHVSCDLQGEAAILGLKDGVYYTLDPVGSRIWELLQRPQTVKALRDTILGEYDVDQVRCESDLQALLSDLQTHGLITFSA